MEINVFFSHFYDFALSLEKIYKKIKKHGKFYHGFEFFSYIDKLNSNRTDKLIRIKQKSP